MLGNRKIALASAALFVFAALLAGCSDAPTGSAAASDSAGSGGDDLTLTSHDTAVATDTVSAELGASDAATDAPDSSPGTCEGGGGGPGCACTHNADCDNSLCITTPTGHFCAVKCVDTCPAGFSCAQVSNGGADITTICVPKWGFLCDPCSTNADCDSLGGGKQTACLDYGDAGHFCGFDCAADADCPAGYTCGEGKTVDGVVRKQCWHGAGVGAAATVCDCSPHATALNLTTSCAAKDASSGAICSGLRHCAGPSLTPCDAKPGKEICNGKDDDCDGLTDNGACDDQNACTQDLCDAVTGTCSHSPLDGAPCNADNTACTQADTCQAGVCKPGTAKTCSDGNLCTDDSCDPQAGCVFVNNSAACDDGKICTTGDACSGGACAPGKTNNCDDGNACTDQACDAVTGNCTTTFNSLNCDDGNACTSSDACKAGVCQAGLPVSCTDADACTLDACDATGGCQHSISTGVCDDGDACTYGETCASGVCNGGAILNCDDQNPCTADSCDKIKACVHSPQNGGCDDGNACTSNDTCVGGACLGAPAGPCASDQNPCTTDQCDPTLGCIHVNNTLPCDDGTVCTQGDTCAGGVCVGGAPLNCADDGNPCTTALCNPVTGCGVVNNTASCDDGDACTTNDTCAGGSCQPGVAKDCAALNTTCGDGKCKLGSCYFAPYPVETACPTGLCDGAGACVTPATYTVDGCTGSNFASCSTWNCYGCKLENGFSAYNTSDCEGTGCFDRFPTFGQNGYVVMEAQWAETAYVQWTFPQPLIGKYKLEAWLPPAIPASADGGLCAADSSTTYAPKAYYHLQTAGNDLAVPMLNHQLQKGTGVNGTLVPLWTGDATGLTGIRLGNGPTSLKPPACQFYLVDAIVATPQP